MLTSLGHPFRSLTSVPVLATAACSLLLSAGVLTANPAGHAEVVHDGEEVAGEDVSAQEEKIFVTDAGATIVLDYQRILSCTPAGVKALVEQGTVLPGGRVVSYLSTDFGGDDFSVNKRGDMIIPLTSTLANGESEQDAYYLWTGGQFLLIASDGGKAPGGGFYNLFDITAGAVPQISNNGKYLIFRSKLSGSPGEAIYRGTISAGKIILERVISIGNPSPAGGTFSNFNTNSNRNSQPQINNDGLIVFAAECTGVPDGYQWYSVKSGNVSVIPGSNWADTLLLSDSGNVLLRHSGYFGGALGDMDSLAYGTVSSVANIVTEDQPTPRGDYEFRTFDIPLLDEAGNVFFTARVQKSGFGDGDSGIYQWSASGLKTIILMTDPLPGGGAFLQPNSFDLVPLGTQAGEVYFRAETNGGGAILRGNGTVANWVIGAGDVLQGKPVHDVIVPWNTSTNLAGHGILNAKGQFAYSARYQDFGNNKGIFIYPYVTYPEIAIEQPVGSSLVDGKANKSFGTAVVGSAGATKTFTIKNLGTSPLTGLSLSITGAGAKDFVATKITAKSLAPGAKATFKITFIPKKTGTRKAVFHIKNNDKNENPFDVALAGEGVKKK